MPLDLSHDSHVVNLERQPQSGRVIAGGSDGWSDGGEVETRESWEGDVIRDQKPRCQRGGVDTKRSTSMIKRKRRGRCNTNKGRAWVVGGKKMVTMTSGLI
jgi:hypothetical protein